MILCQWFLNETTKGFDRVGFSMNRINPSVSSAVINECNIVVWLEEGCFRESAAKIRVDYIERFFGVLFCYDSGRLPFGTFGSKSYSALPVFWNLGKVGCLRVVVASKIVPWWMSKGLVPLLVSILIHRFFLYLHNIILSLNLSPDDFCFILLPAPEFREIPRGRSGHAMKTGRRSVDGNLYKGYNKDEGLNTVPIQLSILKWAFLWDFRVRILKGSRALWIQIKHN